MRKLVVSGHHVSESPAHDRVLAKVLFLGDRRGRPPFFVESTEEMFNYASYLFVQIDHWISGDIEQPLERFVLRGDDDFLVTLQDNDAFWINDFWPKWLEKSHQYVVNTDLFMIIDEPSERFDIKELVIKNGYRKVIAVRKWNERESDPIMYAWLSSKDIHFRAANNDYQAESTRSAWQLAELLSCLGRVPAGPMCGNVYAHNPWLRNQKLSAKFGEKDFLEILSDSYLVWHIPFGRDLGTSIETVSKSFLDKLPTEPIIVKPKPSATVPAP